MSTSRGNTTFSLLPESSLKWLWVNAKLSIIWMQLNWASWRVLTHPGNGKSWAVDLKGCMSCSAFNITSQHLNISNKNFFGACISYNAWVFVSWVRHQKGCVSLETRRCTEAKTHNHTPNANLRNSKKGIQKRSLTLEIGMFTKVHHGKAFVSSVSLVSLLSWGICAINLDLRNYLKPELAPRKKMCDNIATRSQKGYNDFVDFATENNALWMHFFATWTRWHWVDLRCRQV